MDFILLILAILWVITLPRITCLILFSYLVPFDFKISSIPFALFLLCLDLYFPLELKKTEDELKKTKTKL